LRKRHSRAVSAVIKGNFGIINWSNAWPSQDAEEKSEARNANHVGKSVTRLPNNRGIVL